MGSQEKPKIPTFDLSKLGTLEKGSEEWGLICKEMRVGLEQFGCFSVVYDEVSLELHNSIFEATKQLFEVPLETKVKNKSEKPYHGYFGKTSFLPLYESMAIDNPLDLQALQSFTNLMWPHGNNHFRKSVERFSISMVKLDEMITRMIFESYGVSKLSTDSNIESTNHLLRCFKYEVPCKDESDLGLHSHTDLTFFSIIHQHLSPGLQVLSLDDQWIDIEPSSHTSFIVMAGQVIMAWSNERIRACRHRVMIKGKETRYSIGMFSFKNGTICVPKELVDEANPLRFNPFNHLEFLAFDKANLSHQTLSRIKDYCGIISNNET